MDKSKQIKGIAVKIVSAVLVLLAGTLGITFFSGDRDAKPNVPASVQTSRVPAYTGYTFRSSKQLTTHFEKHGKEVGAKDEAEYVDMANRVIGSPDALTKTEAEDGDTVYFIRSTGEIVFLSSDGFIRTYFLADEAYFNRT